MLTQYSKDMERVMRALTLCRMLHEGQTDKCGQPYWIHPFTVAMRCFAGHNQGCISNMIVGLLHDIPEDTGMSIEALATLIELTDDEKAALNLLTRKDGVSYSAYINSILESNNTLAIEVKADDLLHNSNLNRFTDAGINVTDKDERRSQLYSEYFKQFIYRLNEDDI